jgi:hypothetical protein
MHRHSRWSLSKISDLILIGISIFGGFSFARFAGAFSHAAAASVSPSAAAFGRASALSRPLSSSAFFAAVAFAASSTSFAYLIASRTLSRQLFIASTASRYFAFISSS